MRSSHTLHKNKACAHIYVTFFWDVYSSSATYNLSSDCLEQARGEHDLSVLYDPGDKCELPAKGTSDHLQEVPPNKPDRVTTDILSD
jgi:hypothetical protein